MAQSQYNQMEKVTFNMPVELKQQVMALKEELQVSLSVIYNEAIAGYLKQKEMEKWKNGVEIALKDKGYMQFLQETAGDKGDLYEY